MRGVRRHLLITLMLLGLTAGRVAHAEIWDEPKSFDIPAGEAAFRLNDFSAQSGLDLLFRFAAMAGMTTKAVQCVCKPFEALDKMLSGTSIRYEFLNRSIVVVKPPVVSAKAEDRRKRAPPEHDGDADKDVEEEVTVRGSYNSAMLQTAASPVISLTRADIDGASLATVAEMIRTLPQVFGGGPTEDTYPIGMEARTNTARGSGVNLRGLGAGSTLVLVNGNRLAGSGSEAMFVDVSSIPLAAVERIDVLPDSSSTFYGADAVGGIVNFVMREPSEGAQTDAYYGTATQSALSEISVSQVISTRARDVHALVAFDYYSRDQLPAADRRQARSDLRAFGGSNFDVLQANPGNIVVGPFTWAIPHGQDGTTLSPEDLHEGTPNTQNRLEAADILPAQQRTSVFATGRYKPGDRIEWFADALASRRDVRMASGGQIANLTVPATNPFYVNPMGTSGPVNVTYNFLHDLGPVIADTEVRSTQTSFGCDLRLNSSWQLMAIGTASSEQLTSDVRNQVNSVVLNTAIRSPDRSTAFNPFGDGSNSNLALLDELRSSSTLATKSSLTSWRLLLGGPILQTGVGTTWLRLGTEERNQRFRSMSHFNDTAQRSDDRTRRIRAVFAELALPLIGEERDYPGARSLTLSLANRFERYDDFGETYATRTGLSWTPFRDLVLRTTWSESFRPPGLVDLDERTNAYGFLPLRDPQTGLASNVLIWQGKNRDLHEETARSWTLGLVFTPRALGASALAVTYFNTEFSNRINQPSLSADLLSNSSLDALVTRNPSPDFRANVCSRALQPSTLGNCLTTPIAAIADLRLRNDARMRTRGIDLLSRYSVSSRYGLLSLGLNGAYIFEFSESRTSSLRLVNRVSTPNYPVHLRLRAVGSWQRAGWVVTSGISYFNSYRDNISTPSRAVASWTTIDVSIEYSPKISGDTLFEGLSASLGISNLLDTPPPFLNNSIGIGYDQENGDLTGRLVGLRLRKVW